MTMQRTIEGVYQRPGIHWVGDGFRVSGYFSSAPGLVKKLSPFLLLDYHAPHHYPATENKRRGVGPHPHRGFETVSLAWEGSVSHRDSTGAGGVIGPGDVQWMTAASGILHREYHAEEYARRGGPFHMAQLWVNLPRKHKMDAPRYQEITAKDIGIVNLDEGGVVRVIAGEHDGVVGPAKTFTSVRLLDVRLPAAGRATLAVPAKENAALLLMKGGVTVNGKPAGEGDLVLFENEGRDIELRSTGETHLMLLGGEPIPEPVVQYGPFVMSTGPEIEQAIRDFRRGDFGYLEE